MAEIMNLTPEEIRVIGVLIEKQITTPDQYPLSLNALTSGCNQKSNREPVMDMSESDVQQTLDDLVGQHLVTESSGFGSRVSKYQHRFCNTEFSKLQFDDQGLGILCVLFLRGPQTPGELRTRSGRLCQFENVQAVEAALQRLQENMESPYVVQLPREPGKRESRYAHQFCGEVTVAESAHVASPVAAVVDSSETDERIQALELQVAEMRREIDELKSEIRDLS